LLLLLLLIAPVAQSLHAKILYLDVFQLRRGAADIPQVNQFSLFHLSFT